MAELNLKQITDRLNEEFSGDARRLVFWYDDKAEFTEDIDNIVLDNAQVYRLQPDNQFYTKYFLERVDTTTNYLIYAPFPKPDVKENHLEDTLLYSKRFYADRASLLMVDLGISAEYRPVIEQHILYFANKDRIKRFYDLGIENYTEDTIRIGILSALCRAKTCSFEEVVRIVLTDGELTDNQYLAEMGKYDLTSAFWKLCEQYFGYVDEQPSLERLLVTLYVTYTAHYVQADLPAAWQSFVSHKSGNSIAFLDSMMNSVLYREKYDELAEHVAKGLNARAALADYRPDDLIDCDTFVAIDELLVKWLVGRLLDEDLGAALDGLDIPAVCAKRSRMHYASRTQNVYEMLASVYHLIKAARFKPAPDLKGIIDQYLQSGYRIDQEYRSFYQHYDTIEETEAYDGLRTLVENIYTNEYLNTLIPQWNAAIQQPDAMEILPLQREFYNANVRYAKERTVVIISDAMRYEVGQELFRMMQDDPKCTATLSAQLSVLPSYTRLGMAALLPHKTLVMTDDYQVLADGVLCDSLAGRQSVLQGHCANSCCVQFDDIKGMNKASLRDVFTGKQVVYVYHNQIDARGDKANTEDEVFTACKEAVREIAELIRKLAGSANTLHFLVTADHGFLYKRDRLAESDKIGGVNTKNAFMNRRFIVAQSAVIDDGIDHQSMGRILGNDDSKVVSYPISSNVFKMPGGGQNYVHGGSSPQEMLVPVIDIHMEKGHMDTKKAEIALVSTVHKITNLITALDFIQRDAVSDTVKEATYSIYFMAEDNTKISNVVTYKADNRETDSSKRIFRERFTFKNQKYGHDKQYYLVVVDESTGLEQWRMSIVMDIAFADDFGFGF